MRARRLMVTGAVCAIVGSGMPFSAVASAAPPTATARMAMVAALPALGSTGAHVAALQQALIDGGYAIPAGATGFFGSQTRAAVAAFQRAQGWRGTGADGIPGPQTMARLGLTGTPPALNSAAPPAPAAPTAPARPAPAAPAAIPRPGDRGAHVTALQRALIDRGFAIASGATGDYGPQTRNAVAAFQRSQGWRGSGADGIPGPQTMARLGLVGARAVAPSPAPAPARAPAPAAPQAPASPELALPPTQFVARYAPLAERASAVSGVPALVSMAQAALESGWGASAPGFNFFGVKARAGDPANGRIARITTEILPTDSAHRFDDVITVTPRPDGRYEYQVREWFRAYPSAEAAFLEHGLMLAERSRYRPAFAHRGDPYRFAAAIAAGGYATDPGYTAKLHRVMRLIESLR